MDEYRKYRQKRKGGFLKVLLYLAAVAVVAFFAIGVYKLIDDKEELPLTPQVQQAGDESGQSQETSQKTTGQFASLSTGNETKLTAEEVAEKVIPSVVCIQATGNSLSASSQGSGIILSEDGYIATNAHVVSEYSKFKVILSDDTVYEAKLIGADDTTDLALLKVEANGLTPATLGNSDTLKIAETVMAVGNPGGLQFSSSVTMGIVSAKDRPITTDMGASLNTIQTDAAINPGNSGGALVDMTGSVVGICSAKYIVENYEGMGFAITINEALPVLNELKEYGYVKTRGVMGMEFTFVDSMTARFYDLPVGMYVQNNHNDKVKDIEAGDVIIKVNGQEITDQSVLKGILSGKLAGDKLTVTYYKGATGQYYDTEVELIENDNSTAEPSQQGDPGDWGDYYSGWSRYLRGYLR